MQKGNFDLQNYERSSYEKNFSVILEEFKFLQFSITEVSLLYYLLYNMKTSLQKKKFKIKMCLKINKISSIKV